MLSAVPTPPSPAPTPSGSATPSVVPSPDAVYEEAERACAAGSRLCDAVVDLTGSRRVGVWAELLLGTTFKIILILVIGLIARFVLHRVINQVSDRIATGRAGLGRLDDRLPSATAILTTSPLLSARREQRSRTIGSVLRSVTTGTIGVVVLLMILDLIGIPIAPLLASAGILGVAIGFGSQTLVKDFLSGIFMVAEDQYGVGDVVDLGDASGVVEAVGLRVTRVRDVDGTVWYIRNGEVLRVGNRSQGWARAVLDVGIAYGEDVAHAQELLLDVARGLQGDEEFGELVLEDPEMWGVESVSADGVVLRLVVKTQPLQQWTVARELRLRIKERFDAEGIRVAHPQGAVWVAGDGSRPERPAPARAVEPAQDAPAGPAEAPDAEPGQRVRSGDRPARLDA